MFRVDGCIGASFSLALDVKNGTETLDDLNALLPSLHVVVVKFFREGYCCRQIIKLAWFDFVHSRWQYWSLFSHWYQMCTMLLKCFVAPITCPYGEVFLGRPGELVKFF